MKEGYLQIKISELIEKSNKIDQMINMEKNKILLLQEQVGGFKDLLKKLKDIENIKEQTIKYIKQENDKLIDTQIQELLKKINEIIDDSIKNKTKKIEEALNYLEQRKDTIENHELIIEKQKNEIDYLTKFNELLMMKLANKGIITEREINEINKRSKKKN